MRAGVCAGLRPHGDLLKCRRHGGRGPSECGRGLRNGGLGVVEWLACIIELYRVEMYSLYFNDLSTDYYLYMSLFPRLIATCVFKF